MVTTVTENFEKFVRPTEIRLKKAEKILEVDFEDGKRFQYPAEFLRVLSPSAENVGHGPGQGVTVFGRRHIGIMELEPVGNYAVRILFDDLHNTGIYSWRYLYDLGLSRDELWQGYLDTLKAKGLSRDP